MLRCLGGGARWGRGRPKAVSHIVQAVSIPVFCTSTIDYWLWKRRSNCFFLRAGLQTTMESTRRRRRNRWSSRRRRTGAPSCDTCADPLFAGRRSVNCGPSGRPPDGSSVAHTVQAVPIPIFRSCCATEKWPNNFFGDVAAISCIDAARTR